MELREAGMRLLRTIIVLMLFPLSQLVLTSSAEGQITQSLVSTEGHFKVLMPGAVQQDNKLHQNKNGSSSTEYRFYVTQEHGHVAYMVMYSDLPSQVQAGKQEEVLTHIRDSIAAGNTVLSESRIDLKGIPGFEIKLRKNDGMVIRVHEYLSGSRLYQLIISASDGYAAKYADQLLDSFSIF